MQQHTGLGLSCSSACGASRVAQSVKNLPAVLETWVQFLRQEDPLEKEMATHSSILAWKIPWTEEAGGLQSIGYKSRTRLFLFLSECGICVPCIGRRILIHSATPREVLV